MHEIEKVEPIPGAQVVAFDYAAAEDALNMVLTTMPTSVGDQMAPRAAAATAATEVWRGHWRDEFDLAATNLVTRFETLLGYGGIGIAGEIRGAAGRANVRQEEYNEARRRELARIEEERAEAERAAEPVDAN